MSTDRESPSEPGIGLSDLDQRVHRLRAAAIEAYQIWVNADAALRVAIAHRDDVVARTHSAGQRSGAAGPEPVGGAPRGAHGPLVTPPDQPPTSPPPAGPDRPVPGGGAELVGPVREASAHTVQTVLFILGGLLLSTASVVFTAVAWTTFGTGGRAAVLAGVTLTLLALPLLALRRRLRSTAETLATVGLILVVLDGYAAWSVDLAGVRGLPGPRYAGVVAAVAGVVALLYGRLTRLRAPAFVAAIVGQLALPLLAQPAHPSLAGWSLIAAALALGNLAVLGRLLAADVRATTPTGLRVVVAVALAGWLGLAGLIAVAAELLARQPRAAGWAGLSLMVAALVLVAVPRVVPAARAATTTTTATATAGPTVPTAPTGTATARRALSALAGAGLVLAAIVAAARLVALAWPDQAGVAVAAVVAAVAAVVAAAGRITPGRRSASATGRRLGVLLATGVLATPLAFVAAVAGASAVVHALPMWSADLSTGPYQSWPHLTWRAVASILLVTMAAAVTLRPSSRPAVLSAAAVLIVATIPAAVPLPWWAPATLAALGAAALTAIALAARLRRTTISAGLAAGALTIGAVLTGLARPALTAGVLATVVVTGSVAAVVALRRPDRASDRLAFGGIGLMVAMVATPALLGSAAAAAGAPHWWGARLATGGLLLILVTLTVIVRAQPALIRYAYLATLAAALVWPAVASMTGHEPLAINSALALVTIAGALVVMPAEATGAAALTDPAQLRSTVEISDPVPLRPVGAAAVGRAVVPAQAAALPAGVALAIGVGPAILAVVGLPYAWLPAVWSGAPPGVGLAPAGTTIPSGQLMRVAAVALALLAVASGLAAYAVTRRPRRALAGLWIGGPTAVVIGLVAAGAPWPSLPAVTLLIGLSILLVTSLAPIGPALTVTLAAQGVLYLGAGLAGALPTSWSTLAALGGIVVGGAVTGVVGRAVAARVAGWLATVAAALGAAVAAGHAAHLRPSVTAFLMLGVAAAALAVGVLRAGPNRRTESTAIQTAAHAGAAVALLLTVGSPAAFAAGVCAVWGLALGLTALRPGIGRFSSAVSAAVAGGLEVLAWWLLLADRGVSTIEAYTLPMAGVALLAGRAALRRRPDISSWVSSGPALAAAFLPSLAAIADTAGHPGRRLLLGAAALGTVVIGASARRQAPVVIGGLVLALVALHEIVLVSQLLPGWIPLAVGGVLLLTLAVTYERRRRDLGRLRTALSHLH